MIRSGSLAAALSVLLLMPAPSASAEPTAPGRIRVLGRANIEVAADHATVQVGISNKAPTPTAALDQNSAIARRIIDFAKRFGVEPRDLKTASVVLSPVYKTVRDAGGGHRQEPDGYSAENTVEVRLQDISRLGAFMRDVLEEGANRINSVRFGLTDPERAADAARVAAVEDAVRKARLLAEAAKLRLGRIEEITSPPRAEIRPLAEGAAGQPFRRSLAAGIDVPIESGTIEVSAEVDVVWRVE